MIKTTNVHQDYGGKIKNTHTHTHTLLVETPSSTIFLVIQIKSLKNVCNFDSAIPPLGIYLRNNICNNVGIKMLMYVYNFKNANNLNFNSRELFKRNYSYDRT